MISQWSLSDWKSPQISRTLLSILADLKNAIVRMVSTLPRISESLSQEHQLLLVSTVTFMFHSFSSSRTKIQVLILLFTFLKFYSVVSQDRKIHNSAISFFFFFFFFFFAPVIWPILSDPFVCQNPRGVFESHFLGFWVVHIPFVHHS